MLIDSQKNISVAGSFYTSFNSSYMRGRVLQSLENYSLSVLQTKTCSAILAVLAWRGTKGWQEGVGACGGVLMCRMGEHLC